MNYLNSGCSILGKWFLVLIVVFHIKLYLERMEDEIKLVLLDGDLQNFWVEVVRKDLESYHVYKFYGLFDMKSCIHLMESLWGKVCPFMQIITFIWMSILAGLR